MFPKTTTDPIVPVPPATTLSYDQSASLMQDSGFRGRVKVACLSYAQYISLEATSTAAHNSRYRWATRCFQAPDQVGNEVVSPVVMNPNVAQAGSEVTDADLQAAVQAVVDAIM
jgi:hypothetical protein